VKRAHPQPGVDLTYIAQTGEPTGDAGDQYIGLDRFGRVVDLRWLNSSTGVATDRFAYGYDRDSNRLYRDNNVNSAFGELYHANGATNGYDNLGQLTAFARGTLSISSGNTVPDTISSPAHSQSWSLDALGNWNSVTTDGTTQTRTANQQNQITSISGQTTPVYDADGNMTTDQTGKTLVFDAWNRLVQVKSGTTQLEAYTYDPLGRRVTENPGTAKSLYYSSAWQLLEERWSGATQVQYVWSPVYVDAMIERDRGSERFYVQQDANWNVTAIVDTTAAVQERYIYDPYGQPTVLDPSWNTRSASSFAWVYLHQGGRYDTSTGLYAFRQRDYSPTLGRWIQLDPMGFTSGDINCYRYVANDPLSAVDPEGLKIDWETTEKAHATNDFGQSRYKVQWKVDQGADGAIVQHTVITVTVYKKGDDDPLSAEQTKNKPRDFYEGWDVENGDIWNGRVNSFLGKGGADLWGTRSEGPNTRGTIVIKGTVQFFPGKRIPKGWLNPGAPDYVPEAGGLPISPGKLGAPVNFDDTARTRTLTITWDDCADKAEEKVKTKVSLTE
jgi:RHS repeat-associated protein